MERLRGTAASNGPGQLAGGTGSPTQASVAAYGARVTATTIGAGPQAGGMGSPTKAAVGALGAHVGDGSLQRPGPTTWGDGGSCPGGSPCLWSVCGGRHPPAAQAEQLGGRGVPPRRQSVPMERLRGTAAPTTHANQLGGRGVPPRRRAAHANQLGGRGVPPMQHLRGMAATISAGPPLGGQRTACGGRVPPSVGAHKLGGRQVLPKRRSVPMTCPLGTATPVGAGPQAGGTWCPP